MLNDLPFMSRADPSPERQGAAFEENFHVLLGRLIERHLGYELLENRLQPSGSQFGKDIQTRWRTSEGEEVFWQFECKSHKSGSLSAKEVADKLFDLMRSAHQIDVWCLTLANVEPGAWINETFAWARSNLDLPFELEVLSPSQNNIKRLFALEPDLFEQQYPDEPLADLQDDGAVIVDAFGRLLHETTERARRRRHEHAAAWQVVVPERMAFDDAPTRAAAYLKGLTATAPWEVVSDTWAVQREDSVRPLVERILASPPGFDFLWLVAAGGKASRLS